MDHALQGFGNAGGQAALPVRYDGSRLLSCLLKWQNYQMCGEVPVAKLQLKISSSSLFARWTSTLWKVGGMSSRPGAPFDLRCRIARSSFDYWNGLEHASSTVGDLRVSFN